MAMSEFPRPIVVSAADDPDLANRISQEVMGEAEEDKQDIVEVPMMPVPPDTLVKLPGGGLLDADGTLHDEAEVKELTGADEEALSKADATKSYSRYIQTLVRRGVVRVGTHERLTDALLGELLIGDRETLLLAIRRATYGDTLKMSLICPSCMAGVDVTYDLRTEIPIKELDEPRRRKMEVKLRKGESAILRIPTAADQDAVLAASGKTQAEKNTMYIGRCLETIDGVPARGTASALSLGAQDRSTLVKALFDSQPGPKYEEVMIECPGCGNESPLQVSLAALFRSE